MRAVRKVYGDGRVMVEALRGISLEISRGEFVCVMGPSGSGKSTMLNLIGALDRPSEGEVLLNGRAYSTMSDDELALLRRRQIGFVFQFFNLLPTLTVRENVLLPVLLDGRPSPQVEDRAEALLERVGLGARALHRPAELSGGEMQRVAIARALVTKPPILLADEPTGNLDQKTGHEVLTLLRRESAEADTTVVMVTHDVEASAVASRIITLRDGHLVENT